MFFAMLNEGLFSAGFQSIKSPDHTVINRQTSLYVLKLVVYLFKINQLMISPKERIMDVTFGLFANQGYNSTGINQIISEAKVAKASFYQHFKSKEDLCVAFLNARHTYWFGELNNFINDKKGVKSKVLSSFDFLIHMNSKENFRGCSFLNILSEIPVDNIKILTVIQEHKKELRNFFSDLIKDNSVSDHAYMLFESSIIETQMFKSNELIEKSKKIVSSLIE